MDDVRENEMLHIENSELRYTNRALLAQLADARAALDKATESQPFSQHDELQQLRTSNHYMTEELTRLREERNAEAKDLAEARADVQRFEAALDVSQRELAEARAERVDALNRLGAGQVEYDSLYASLLDCQTERDEAEQITAAYAEEVAEAEDDLDRQRRTIRALVVAARAMWYVLWKFTAYGSRDVAVQIMHAQQAENTAQFRAFLMGKNPGYLKQAERNQTTHD